MHCRGFRFSPLITRTESFKVDGTTRVRTSWNSQEVIRAESIIIYSGLTLKIHITNEASYEDSD
jgi:hypothetical protein